MFVLLVVDVYKARQSRAFILKEADALCRNLAK